MLKTFLYALQISGVLFLFFYGFYFSVRHWLQKKDEHFPRVFDKYIHKPGIFLILILIFYIIKDKVKYTFITQNFNIFSHIVNIILIMTVGFFVYKLLALLQIIILRNYAKKQYKDLTARVIKTKLNIITQIINVFIFLFVLAAILLTFDRVKDLGTTVLASAGIATIFLGFAAQKSLSSLFNGIQIALTQPIKIDDNVVIDNKSGTVAEINLTNVVLNTWDEKRLIIPIAYFVENPVENWTHISPEITAVVKVYADYSVPIDYLRNTFNHLLEQSEFWDKRRASFFVTNVDHKNIELRATMTARNPEDAFLLECYIREELIKVIQNEFPQALPSYRVSLLK